MSKFKTFILITGDIAVLYAALFLTLILRYGPENLKDFWASHLTPFSLIFIIWLLIFYLADLYKDINLRSSLDAFQIFAIAIAVSVVSSIIFFYLFPSIFQLTPKTNLIIFTLVFGILDIGWRFLLTRIYISSGLKNKLLFVGESPIIKELVSYLKNNPQIGYDVSVENDISKISEHRDIDILVVQPHIKKEKQFIEIFYDMLASRIAVIDSTTFYEMIFQKLPLDELEESWFIEKITTQNRFYGSIRRILGIILSIFLIIIFLPFFAVIVILTKLSSRQGPVIYKQERVGMNNKTFTLYKFGVMKQDTGPLATAQGDERFTLLGKILNRTHLNEIPQLYNILKGELAFIGPRAERRELVKIYEQLPHYELRHIVKPGLTGWAQLNYKPSASLEEAKEKLAYDLYYIKNHSLVLDLLILIKTTRYFFVAHR